MATNLLDSWFKYPIGDGAFFSVFGFVFVFFGILLLIIIISILGKVIYGLKRTEKKRDIIEEKQLELPIQAKEDAKLDPQVVAAITAALMAYYQTEQPKCEFVVRRIRKI